MDSSGESLLLCSPKIYCFVFFFLFFSALFTEVRLFTRIHLCIPIVCVRKRACVCVRASERACVWAFYAKISYTREVKNHSYASCELIWLR